MLAHGRDALRRRRAAMLLRRRPTGPFGILADGGIARAGAQRRGAERYRQQPKPPTHTRAANGGRVTIKPCFGIDVPSSRASDGRHLDSSPFPPPSNRQPLTVWED